MDIHFRDGSPDIPGAILYREEIPSEIAAKDRVIQALLAQLEELGFADGQKESFRYRLCLDEVIQNALQHGNRMAPNKRVTITLFVSDDQWGVVVTDEGAGFSADSVPTVEGPEALLRESGRGLWILSEYMDQLSYFDGGRTAFLAKRMPR